ncbi:4-alpha-glucanotransferase [Ornithinicoccus halotolerans]|uniref:4-alpha-glucanotransferase n=1 Tax=Ornithinicoccus halotolerans TaxID=1748220 RepID=UPI001295FF11|nr:4-alpha-glucanotransferase [Ornithinicoccus halotolerans]
MPSSLPESLVELARAYGVATDFTDWQGRPSTVPEQTIRRVLAALDVPAGDDVQTATSLRANRDREWRHALPPTVVTVAGRSQQVPLHAPVPAAHHGAEAGPQPRLLLESGEERVLPAAEGPGEQRELDGQTVARWTLRLPEDLPLGWHRLEVTGAGERPARATLVVTPARLEVSGHGSGAADQRWGVMTQLYAMRSARSWGTGDLADLGDLGAWAAGLGADFVLVNPLHAAEPVPPMEPSPYLPTTRRFVNPIYVRVEDVPEVGYLSAAERQLVEWHADDARRYLELDFLERDAVWQAKEGALRLVFKQPRSLRRERAFQAFCEGEGQELLDFATWCALVGRHGPRWRDWPEELHDPRGEATARAREELASEVEFYCWLQWVLADQLAGVQRDLRDTGMRLGVVHDLAVGVHPDGADSWMLGDALARGVTVGAPPDQYNQRGQDWSQPPWRPDRLAELGYAPYRAMLRAVLRDAGGLRVDHVMGLFRLWWVPQGSSPDQGTYVRYDHEAMVGILLLEAHRAGALVVGEDLGTVEPWVRDYLRDRAILGTSILWFERTERGPMPAEEYRELCLATVTTHDLPPTAGYLTGEHIRLRAGLGLLTRPEELERAEDEAAREEVLAVLRERGLLREGATVAEQVEALHRYLTWTPALLLGVSVSDLAEDRRIINQPGTADEYPNWRVPLAGPEGRPLLLEELFARRSARRLARTVTRQG